MAFIVIPRQFACDFFGMDGRFFLIFRDHIDSSCNGDEQKNRINSIYICNFELFKHQTDLQSSSRYLNRIILKSFQCLSGILLLLTSPLIIQLIDIMKCSICECRQVPDAHRYVTALGAGVRFSPVHSRSAQNREKKQYNTHSSVRIKSMAHFTIVNKRT